MMEVTFKRMYEVRQNNIGETKKPMDVSQVFCNDVLVGYVYDTTRYANLLHPILTEEQFTQEQRQECIRCSGGRLIGSIDPPAQIPEDYFERAEDED